MKYFLAYRFDERDGSLSRDASHVAITRKAADLLRCLIERAGSVVSHEAILASVWPDAHVQPDNIKVLVRELRRALDDDPHAPQYIRTVNGRGYAFVAPLHELAAATPAADPVASLYVRANRPQHLAVLADALSDVSQSSRCMVAVIEGERGIGKTTLCQAFMKYAAAMPSTRVCYGQSFRYSTAPAPYSAISNALLHLIRQSPDTLEALLATHAPLWRDHLRPRDPGGHLREEVDDDPVRRVSELGAFLDAVGAFGPIVIVLDDLQWADGETITLIQALARRHAPLRALIVLTCTRLPPTASGTALWRLLMELWSTGRCIMRRLKALSEDDVRWCLVERFSQGPMAALAPTLHRLTGGNPLALSAVVQALAADLVARGADGWRLRHPDLPFEASLSENAREAVLWRFTQLDVSNQILLDAAASLGSTFTAGDVAAAARLQNVSRVERQLDALCLRGFIERVGTEPPGVKRYAFGHPMHAELLATRAALFDQLYAGERLAADDRGVAGAYN